jgi:uncharacterized protein (TIGR03083 family)
MEEVASLDTWDMIRTERSSLVDALAGLPATDWSKPSLAAGWSVRDVVAHMIATAQMTPGRFVGRLAGSGFRFHNMAQKNIDEVKTGRSDQELVDLFRSLTGARTAPPGPTVSWLGETIVHGEDVFRSLGAYRDHPPEHVTTVANFYVGSNLLIGAKNRVAGVTLQANDADWSHGEGPSATGPAIALVMAMCGRKTALDDLSGPGVDLLRSRP